MPDTNPPFPADSLCTAWIPQQARRCGGQLQLCESGYIRTYQSIVHETTEPADITVRQPDGSWKRQRVSNVAFFKAYEDYPASFSDEGDGEQWVECRQCLNRYDLPEHFEIEYT